MKYFRRLLKTCIISFTCIVGITVPLQAQLQQDRHSLMLQEQAMRAISTGMALCTIDNGSNYSTLPLRIALRSPDSRVQTTAFVHLKGHLLDYSQGSIVFTGYNDTIVEITGRLDYRVSYPQGSADIQILHYQGKLNWNWLSDASLQTDAEYDYTIHLENGNAKYSGTVKSHGSVYILRPDGSVDLER